MSGRSFALRFLSVAALVASMSLTVAAGSVRAAEPDEVTADAKAAFDKRIFTVDPA